MRTPPLKVDRESYFLPAAARFFCLLTSSSQARMNTATMMIMPTTGLYMAVMTAMASMQSWPVPSAPTEAKWPKSL